MNLGMAYNAMISDVWLVLTSFLKQLMCKNSHDILQAHSAVHVGSSGEEDDSE